MSVCSLQEPNVLYAPMMNGKSSIQLHFLVKSSNVLHSHIDRCFSRTFTLTSIKKKRFKQHYHCYCSNLNTPYGYIVWVFNNVFRFNACVCAGVRYVCLHLQLTPCQKCAQLSHHFSAFSRLFPMIVYHFILLTCVLFQ